MVSTVEQMPGASEPIAVKAGFPQACPSEYSATISKLV